MGASKGAPGEDPAGSWGSWGEPGGSWGVLGWVLEDPGGLQGGSLAGLGGVLGGSGGVLGRSWGVLDGFLGNVRKCTTTNGKSLFFGVPRASWGCPGGLYGPNFGPNRLQNQLGGLLEASLGGPGRVLGSPGGVLEGSWGGLGASRGCLGAFWGRLGALGPPPRRPGTPQTGVHIDIWCIFGGVWARGGNLTEGGTLDNPGQSNIQRPIKQSIGQ